MDSSILVIGAGASGVSAAVALHKKGFKNVKVYEGRDRIGGRIHSVPQNGGAVIEFGAQWIHGQKGNPVFDICNANGLVDHECLGMAPQFAYWHQLTEKENEWSAKVFGHLMQSIDELSELSNNKFLKEGKHVAGSIYEFLEKKFRSELLDPESDPEARKVYEWTFEWMIRLQNEVNGYDARKVSANYIGEFHDYEGNNLTQLSPQGYRGFLNLIMKSIPEDWIHTQVEVTNIDYSELPLKVTSTRGVETFNYVICTVPLGVLKERKLSLFTPQLPSKKIETIDALGFGYCNKIYLYFEEKDTFWKSGEVFQILWKTGVPESDKKWFHHMTRMNAVVNQPNLLACWVSSEGAKLLEAESDETLLNKCHEILTMVLQKESVPKPKGLKRSGWVSDPFSRGSYSYISTDSDKGEFNALLPESLSTPILVNARPALCFAGEATSSHHFSTVPGAYMSGEREADRIAAFVKQNSSNSK